MPSGTSIAMAEPNQGVARDAFTAPVAEKLARVARPSAARCRRGGRRGETCGIVRAERDGAECHVTIMPAPTVRFVVSSITMKLPVVRLST